MRVQEWVHTSKYNDMQNEHVAKIIKDTDIAIVIDAKIVKVLRAIESLTRLNRSRNIQPRQTKSTNAERQTNLMITMGGKSHVKLQTNVPSPNKQQYNYERSYDVAVKYPTIQYSFGKSERKFKTMEGPGPANYTVNSTHQIIAPVTFGKQQRDKNRAQRSPGSGSYNCQNANKGEIHQYSFPKQKKFMLQESQQKLKSKLPSPNTYLIGNFIRSIKGCRFNKEQRKNFIHFSKDRGGPGPSTYTISEDKLEFKPTIGHQKRQTFKCLSTPGPGTYQTPKSQVFLKKDGTTSFTHAQKLKAFQPITPGPGAYQLKEKLESKSYSIAFKHYRRDRDRGPGPQDYNPEVSGVKQRPSVAVFGSQQKFQKYKTQIPGPGQYTPDVKLYSRTFYFSKAKRGEKLNSTVGPGHYKLKPYIGIYDGAEKQVKEILYV